ncbi:unnamed protein product, partial [Discosporangium mesarthrocarpum]
MEDAGSGLGVGAGGERGTGTRVIKDDKRVGPGPFGLGSSLACGGDENNNAPSSGPPCSQPQCRRQVTWTPDQVEWLQEVLLRGRCDSTTVGGCKSGHGDRGVGRALPQSQGSTLAPEEEPPPLLGDLWSAYSALVRAASALLVPIRGGPASFPGAYRRRPWEALCSEPRGARPHVALRLRSAGGGAGAGAGATEAVLSPARILRSSSLDVKLLPEGVKAQQDRAMMASRGVVRRNLASDSQGRLAVAESQTVLVVDPVGLLALQHLGGASPAEVPADRSHLCVVSKAAVGFDVVGLGFNLANERHLVAWGLRQCSVVVVDSQGVVQRVVKECAVETCLLKAIWVPGSQVLLAVVCSQFVRVYDLSKDASAPLHTYYLPATVEDAADSRASFIQDAVLVPPQPLDPSLAGRSLAPALAAPSRNPEPLTDSEHEAISLPRGGGSGPQGEMVLATAVVLTGSGRLFAKGILAPRGGDGGGGDYGPSSSPMMEAESQEEDRTIRHQLVIPRHLEEPPGPPLLSPFSLAGSSNLTQASSLSASRAGVVAGLGTASGRSFPSARSPVLNRDLAAVFGGSSPFYPGGGEGGGRAVSGDLGDDTMDESDDVLPSAVPGIRQFWPLSSALGTATAPAASAPAPSPAPAPAPTSVAAVSSWRGGAAASKAPAGSLFFSLQAGLLVVTRRGLPTLALRV